MSKQTNISLSLDSKTLENLDLYCQTHNCSREKAISVMISKYTWEERWGIIRKWGRATAKKFNLKSEMDVYKFLGDA